MGILLAVLHIFIFIEHFHPLKSIVENVILAKYKYMCIKSLN